MQPRRLRYRDPVTDELREEELTPAAVAAVVRLYAYTPQLAAMLPRSLAEATDGRLHVAGLCNRNLTAFAAELPALLPEAEAVGA